MTAAIDRFLQNLMRNQFAGRFLRIFFSVASIAVALLALKSSLAARPLIDGVDFYLVVLYARDLAQGAADIPLSRYIYFPGIYTFWKIVYAAGDGHLAGMQQAYVGVLIGNAVLTGAILSTVTGYWLAGLLAGVFYLVEGSRIESLYGCAEPIVTLSYLLGLWIWLLLSRRGAGTAGLLALATGFGLALYTKQQGGLLALGAAGLLPALRLADPPDRYTLRQWLLVPLVSAGVFALAMLIEGGGTPAVTTGLQFAAAYPPEGSWSEHLVSAWRMTQPFSNFLPAGIAVCVIGWRHRDRLPPLPVPYLLVLGISIGSVLGGLVQFSKRGYLHYALLILPSLLLVTGITLDAVIRWLVPVLRDSPQTVRVGAAGGTAVLLLLHAAGTPAFVQHASAQLAAPAKPAGFTERVKETFPPLCQHVPPGSELLLIPSREQVVHWMCRTRAVGFLPGYAWWSSSSAPYLEALSSPDLVYVFLFSDDAGPYERQFFLENGRSRMEEELKQRGFRDVFTFEGGTLYRKPVPGGPSAG
jgi:hypothetical protein